MDTKNDVVQSPILVSFGIPTVDLSYLVTDESVIEKYHLNIDSQREMSFEFLDRIDEECHKREYRRKILAGGNSQVSTMIFQNLINIPNATVMCGAIGDDEEGMFLQEYLENKCVTPKFTTIDKSRTAKSLIVVHRDCRTIAVANGAGSEFSLCHCSQYLNETLNLVESSVMTLMEGFFVGFSYEIAIPVIRKCLISGTILVVNISGVYLVENHFAELFYCLMKSDLLIGNRSEFDSLCERIGLSTKSSLTDRVKIVHRMMLSNKSAAGENDRCKLRTAKKWRKILIVTNNKNPIYCVSDANSSLIKYRVPELSKDEIVDTCGAGDSFLGGFLYALTREYSLEKCLGIGCSVSSRVVRTHGYEIDDQKDYLSYRIL